MDKSTIQTAAIIATIVTVALLISGKIDANSAAVAELRTSINKSSAELREDMRELRGLLVTHIAGHNHTTIVTNDPLKKAVVKFLFGIV